MENAEIYNKFKDLDQKDLDKEFVEACKYGNLEIVKYLLTSPELKKHANLYASDDSGFKNACHNGHLDIIEYIITSDELKDYPNSRFKNKFTFSDSYVGAIGDFDTFKLLNELLRLSGEDACILNEVVIKYAAQRGHSEVVKYMLNYLELDSHPKRNEIKEFSFFWASRKNFLDIANFLIFDMNIEKSEDIEEFLKEEPNKQVEHMFELRKLNGKLREELPSAKINDKKMKI